jgi:3-oxoacyl-[acyl-carrier protein] reductase
LGPDDEAFEADWRYAFDVNVMAAARLARAAADALGESKGVVVLVSSAWRQRPGSAMPASYGAAKAALDDLTQSLAREFGPHGVRVVGIAPGPIWTENWEADLQAHAAQNDLEPETLREAIIAEAGGATALRRPGTMDEVARAICWVASGDASYLTGTTLVIDGGFVAGT